MSYLRKVATLQKVDRDPAKAVTISLPASLSARVEEVIQDTGLSRSAVYQALIKDGLVEYMNAPFHDFFQKIESAPEDVDEFELPSELFPSDEERLHLFSRSEIFQLCQAKIEANRKAVWG